MLEAAAFLQNFMSTADVGSNHIFTMVLALKYHSEKIIGSQGRNGGKCFHMLPYHNLPKVETIGIAASISWAKTNFTTLNTQLFSQYSCGDMHQVP